VDGVVVAAAAPAPAPVNISVALMPAVPSVVGGRFTLAGSLAPRLRAPPSLARLAYSILLSCGVGGFALGVWGKSSASFYCGA
jgi:hypothetical protein